MRFKADCMNSVASKDPAAGNHVSLVDSHPLSPLAYGSGTEQTQGLDSRSLFRLRDGRVEPALQPLSVPVRAIVLPLREETATERLAAAVREHILPISADAGIWLQDPKKYHSTLYHASPHQVCALFIPFQCFSTGCPLHDQLEQSKLSNVRTCRAESFLGLWLCLKILLAS